MSLVRCRVLVATLFVTRWCDVGETVKIDEKRARFLASKKGGEIVKILGPATDDPIVDDDSGEGSGDDDSGSSSGAKETTLEAAGITGRTADLLKGEGFQFLEELEEAIATGFQLTSISGIGTAVASTVKSQIESFREGES